MYRCCSSNERMASGQRLRIVPAQVEQLGQVVSRGAFQSGMAELAGQPDGPAKVVGAALGVVARRPQEEPVDVEHAPVQPVFASRRPDVPPR